MESATLWTRCAGPAGAYANIYPTQPTPEARTTPAPTMRLDPAPRAVPTHLEPTTAYGCLKQGREATANGDLNKALTHFDRAIEHDPKMGIAHFCRALCLLEQGRDEEAAQSLDNALATAPTDPTTRIQLARLYATNGQTAMAMKLLAPTLQTTPQLADKIAQDPNFNTLHDHPTFLSMIGAI